MKYLKPLETFIIIIIIIYIFFIISDTQTIKTHYYIYNSLQ